MTRVVHSVFSRPSHLCGCAMYSSVHFSLLPIDTLLVQLLAVSITYTGFLGGFVIRAFASNRFMFCLSMCVRGGYTFGHAPNYVV